jgi:hydrogenase large subunit
VGEEMRKITIDPMTRIEGHLKIEVVLDEKDIIVDARSSGVLYRGIELILKGRDPRDAARLTQRVCGVCPVPHGTASAFSLDAAFGISDKIPDNGRILRNLILGSEYVHNHILHFYHLSSLDYVDMAKASEYKENDFDRLKQFIQRGYLAPFVPRYEGDYRLRDEDNKALALHYLHALEMRRKAHEMLSLFGGRTPIQAGIVAGGVTCEPTTDKIVSFLWRVNELRDFIVNAYLPDVERIARAYSDCFEIGVGCKRLLSFGFFDLDGSEPDYQKRKRLMKQGSTDKSLVYKQLDVSRVSESVRHSWYTDDGMPNVEKEGAYSFIKSPRYDGSAHEVGPLARILISYAYGDENVKEELDGVLQRLSVGVEAMFSLMGRHIARAVEAKLIADALAEWVLKLKPGEPAYIPYEMPSEAEGVGLVDAPRGCLGHWIGIQNGLIANYSIISPTTWNASPKDDSENHGPIEQALIGTKVRDPENPFEVVRVVRSFDPCLACAVHMFGSHGRKLGEAKLIA